MDWFIARNGKPVGPLTFDALVDAARRGQLNQEDYVWQPGAETWERADCLAVLWDPPSSSFPDKASALVRKRPGHWFGIGVLGLAVFGTLLATGVAGIALIEQTFGTIQTKRDTNHARPIKKDCAFNDYLQGRCR